MPSGKKPSKKKKPRKMAPAAPAPPPPPPEPPPGEMLLETKDLRKKFDEREVVKGVSL